MRIVVASLLLVLFAIPTPALAPTPKEKQPPQLDERTKQSVDRALKYLQTQQNSDGSWGNTAITAFSILAFMSNGNVPNQGAYGPVVSKGIRYLLSCARDDGYLVGPRGGNMYCHGMATLALSQAYGMSADDEVKKILKKAVDLIVKTQNNEGGWRYDPAPTGADISVTIMQVMALRGAKDSGLQVSDDVMKKALAYINRCRDGSGGYRYQPYSSGPGYARTAAGVCVLQLCGQYDAKEISAAVEYLKRTGDDRQHYWYGHYYAAHAFHQIGGKTWDEYYKRMKETLLSKQRDPTGEWYDRLEQSYGPAYQTAIAILILSVPTHYLPIYQR